MDDEAKQRAGFAQLVEAVGALKRIVDRSELQPMTIKSGNGPLIDDTDIDTVVLPPRLAKQVFEVVLDTLRDACEQGARPPIVVPQRPRLVMPNNGAKQ